MSEFSDRLNKKIKESGLKRTAFADEVGIKNQSITDWEKRGTIPAGDVCLRMADFLDVPVGWLISGKAESGINDEELELIRKFRGLKPGNKNAVSVFISALYVQDRAESVNNRIS